MSASPACTATSARRRTSGRSSASWSRGERVSVLDQPPGLASVIDPAKITETLGKKPTRAWQAGTPRVKSNGDPLPGTYRETYWTSRLRKGEWVPDAQSSEYLAQAIEEPLRDLAKHKSFFHELRADGGTVEFFVGWFFYGNTGEVFRHDLLRKLADLQIGLSFDIYPRDRSPPEPQ